MSAVDLRLYARAASPHPKAVLRDEVGNRLVLPFAPTGYDAEGWARKWVEVERPGRVSVLVDTGPSLASLAFTIVVARPGGDAIDDLLDALKSLASRPNAAITVTGLSVAEEGPWRFVECGARVLRRQHGTNAATIAEVSITFAAVTELRARIARSRRAA